MLRVKPVFFIVYLFFFSFLSYSQQNLVYNGDFEEYSSCPESESFPTQIQPEIEKCAGWTAPTYGTSDYFNSCTSNFGVSVPDNYDGHQFAFNGNGYLGGYFSSYSGGSGNDGYSGIMWWEYIQGKLIQPLENSKIYKVSLEVSLAEYSDLMINEIGIYFSGFPISSSNTVALTVTPQVKFYDSSYFNDTINWIHLETLYTANGGECYLTIGNFRDNITTDTLRRYDNKPILVNPNVTYFYIDNVQIVELETSTFVPNVFTPNEDGVNDIISFPNKNSKITIMNRWGNVIFEIFENNLIWNGNDQNGNKCVEGVYYYKYNDLNLSGFIHLVR